MWQTLMNWLPDLRVGTFELRDLLSLGMAGLGAYLAYLAIKMGREQTRIGKEQTEIAKRQEALDIEQGTIAKRQAEIAELQHQIYVSETRRQSNVVLEFLFQGPTDEGAQLRLSLRNLGTRTARGIYWHIYIEPDLAEYTRYDWNRYAEPTEATSTLTDGEHYRHYKHFRDEWTRPLYAGTVMWLGTFTIDHQAFASDGFQCFWNVICEDSRTPTTAESLCVLAVSQQGIIETGELPIYETQYPPAFSP